MPRKPSVKKPLIGFIGQGFVGKNYADDFEHRGFAVVRYAMEEPFRANKEKIRDCEIVFVAVPTPTTPNGFDFSTVRSVLSLVGKGKSAVIKSTVLPGTTETLQKAFPDIFIFHSPEFLTEATAAFDAAHPHRNIIGIPRQTAVYRKKAGEVMAILPRAPYQKVTGVREAELIKYGGNCWFYFKVIFMNLLYDLSRGLGADFEAVREGMAADPRIGTTHLKPVHQGGRGAGGHCFIKDFAAFSLIYQQFVKDPIGQNLLAALAEKNNDLLVKSGKDHDLLQGVYGAKKKI